MSAATTTKGPGVRKAAPAKPVLMFARAIEASVEGEAPEAARIWRAGWNKTDKGDLNFTPRSAKLVATAYATRGNPLAWYYEHEDRIPIAQRGGAPMRGVCSAPSSELAIRDGEGGPECWAEHIAWTDEARRQIRTGERRQLSPVAAFDSGTREIVEILNVSLCAEGATSTGTILASAGKGTSMDELIQALMAALNEGDFEAAESIIAQMEAADGGANMASMAKEMVKMAKDKAPAAPAAEPAPAGDEPIKKLAATREPMISSDAFSRGMEQLERATLTANAAAKDSRRATVEMMIATSRDCFDVVDEREHVAAADPERTRKHVASIKRKMAETGVLAASRDGAAGGGAKRPEAKAPGVDPKADDTFGLDATQIAAATEAHVSLKDYAASVARLPKGRGLS